MIGLVCMVIVHGAKPIYQSSSQKIDENLKLKEVTLVFDISEIQTEYPDFNNLGIGCNASQNEDPTKEKALKLYKGTRENGELLDAQYENRLQTGELFRAGNEITFYYNDIQLEEGTTYTLYAYYTFFVNPAGKTNGAMKSKTKLVYTYDNPIIIQFEATSQQTPTLKFVESVPSENDVVKTLSDVEVLFDSDIKILDASDFKVSEKGVNVASPISATVNNENQKQLLIKFDNVPLYKTHSYELEIPANCLVTVDNDQILNEAIRIPLNGDSWKYIKNGRVYPPSNSEIVESPLIQIPIIFPEGYGFISLSSGPEIFKGYWYEGDKEENRTEVDVEINVNANGVEVNPNFPLVPGKKYTFVFPEGQIVPRSLSDRRKLGDTSNATYTLNYYTPAIDGIASVSFAGLDQSEASADKIEKLSFKINPYMYKDVEYNLLNMGAKAILYVNGDKTASAEYPLDIVSNGNEKTLETKEPINLVMKQGSTYRFVIPENKIVPMHEMFRTVGGNKETSFVYTGTTPAPYTLTYAVEGQATLVTEVAPQAEVKVSFPENDGFKVASIAFNGEQQAVAETFTTPAIAKNSVLDIAYEYAGKIDYDFTTGVTAPEDCPFTVTSEGEMLVVEGVKAGDTIRIYTAGGLMMADLGAVPAGMSRASFRLATGQVYILLVNTTALKLRH